jgi:hypothetical protein
VFDRTTSLSGTAIRGKISIFAALIYSQAMDFYARAVCIDRSGGTALWSKLARPACQGRSFSASLNLELRDALWAIKALRDEPLPLSAAAAERGMYNHRLTVRPPVLVGLQHGGRASACHESQAIVNSGSRSSTVSPVRHTV